MILVPPLSVSLEAVSSPFTFVFPRLILIHYCLTRLLQMASKNPSCLEPISSTDHVLYGDHNAVLKTCLGLPW